MPLVACPLTTLTSHLSEIGFAFKVKCSYTAILGFWTAEL